MSDAATVRRSATVADQGYAHIALAMAQRYAAETAAELERSDKDAATSLLADLSPAEAAAIVGQMTLLKTQQVLEGWSPELAAQMLRHFDPSKAASLLARLDAADRDQILAAMEPHSAQELTALISYPADSAGALMDPRVMAFRPEMTVDEVTQRLRSLPQKKARDVFVVDADNKLLGAVALQSLAVAPGEQPLEELMDATPISVLATASRNDVVDAMAQETMASVVAVDVEGRLLGVIRRDALIQAAREEAVADVQAMVGAGREERALSGVTLAVRKRLPWLVINLATAFIAAAVVGFFESIIAKFTALAVLLPVVAGQSGNTGAQALAVTMRGLALREVRTRHATRVCFKELRVALLNGIAVALITATAVYLWSRSPGLSLVIGVSMILSMMAAGLAGAAIPMILNALKQDPAQSSSIILTTVTDVVGFFSFLSIATALSAWI